jgi:hypothetical protein
MDKIREKLVKDLYTVSVLGSSEAVYEEMYDDIESLLILFSAKNRAIEHRIEELEKEKESEESSFFRAECDIRINELKNFI